MATYGLQADVNANQGKDVQLYVPGQTKIGAGDVFLGGTGTGVADAALNGATRIWGADRGATASAYDNYLQGQNAAPKPIDVQSNIDALKQAQISGNVAALGKSRDAALSNLSAEKATIAPQFYDKRNAEATNNLLQAKNFAEFMSQRNGGNPDQGVANQAQIANNVALQGGLNTLNQQEQAANTDIARRTTDVGNSYASDVASAQAGAEATALQNTISQMNADRLYNFNVGNALGTINGQQTVAGRQADASIANSNANTEYQRLVNANYPAEQAAKMAQAAATLSGTNLQNDYQSLVNAGYPAEEAMKLAQAQASIAQTNAQTNAIRNPRISSGGSGLSSSGTRSSSGSSGSSSGSTSQTNAYNQFVNDAYSQDPEATYKKMTANSDALINAMGAGNYQKAIGYVQDKYYNQVLANWGGATDALRQEISQDTEHKNYYQQVLGLANYNKIMGY